MYQFTIVEPFNYPLRQTYEATTKEFDPLQPYIPNVTLIKTLECTEISPHCVRWYLRFHGDGAIPAIARPVINPTMLRWNEILICDHEHLTIEWEIIADHFTEHVHCKGITYYHEAPHGTNVEIQGTFAITLDHLPGLPDYVVKKAVNIVEVFIGKLIEPNIKRFYQAVKQRMEDELNKKG
ncbi:MAG: hypothetical protein HQK77_06655 [Desulfobacterales bacterium]|nr:hypothetical protein [Desulfobacterales bacterium]